jgi:hypothetical protein
MIRSFAFGATNFQSLNCGGKLFHGCARRQFASPSSKPESTSTFVEEATSLKAETAALQLEGLIESQYLFNYELSCRNVCF